MTAKTKRIDLVDPPKPHVFDFADCELSPIVANFTTSTDAYSDSVKYEATLTAFSTKQFTDCREASMKLVLEHMRDLLNAEISKLA